MCKFVIFALKRNVRNLISVMTSFSERDPITDTRAFLQKQEMYSLKNIDLQGKQNHVKHHSPRNIKLITDKHSDVTIRLNVQELTFCFLVTFYTNIHSNVQVAPFQLYLFCCTFCLLHHRAHGRSYLHHSTMVTWHTLQAHGPGTKYSTQLFCFGFQVFEMCGFLQI